MHALLHSEAFSYGLVAGIIVTAALYLLFLGIAWWWLGRLARRGKFTCLCGADLRRQHAAALKRLSPSPDEAPMRPHAWGGRW